jgi:alkylhydroperoxidase family enzyme
MPYLPSSHDIETIPGLLALYPRRGILLFKMLEDNKDNFLPQGKGTRELLIAFISALNKSESCYKIYKRLSIQLGVDELICNQLMNDINSAAVEDKLKPIFFFVKKLTLTPEQITQADVKPILDAGWEDSTLLDSIYLCSVVNCMNRLAIGNGIDKTKSTNKKPLSKINPNGLMHLIDLTFYGNQHIRTTK